jgi:hypothetical protein
LVCRSVVGVEKRECAEGQRCCSDGRMFRVSLRKQADSCWGAEHGILLGLPQDLWMMKASRDEQVPPVHLRCDTASSAEDDRARLSAEANTTRR